MTAAEGVHAHATKKTGKRLVDPAHGPRLLARRFFTALPAHPVAMVPPHLTWPMDLNDKVGCCVVAGLDHALQAIHAALGVPRANWTESEIVSLYKTQNPLFVLGSEAHDEGMSVQDFLTYLTKAGVILGFAAIDPHDDDEVQAALYLGLAIVTGEDLRVAQQEQATWDYVARSADWGGHCTCSVGYTAKLDDGVSWGALQPMTEAFRLHQIDEAYMIITQAHVDHPGFRAGFDLEAYAAAYTSLTGRPFPAVVPPAPAPTPAPAPVPAPTPSDLDVVLAAALRRLLKLTGVPHWFRTAAEGWLAQH